MQSIWLRSVTLFFVQIDFPESAWDRANARAVFEALDSEDRIAAAIWLVRAIAAKPDPIQTETVADILDIDPDVDLAYLGSNDPLSMLELSELILNTDGLREAVATFARTFYSAAEVFVGFR